MLFELSQHQTEHISGGTFDDITREMPDCVNKPFEKFYNIIIKSLCDYNCGEIDFSIR